MLSSSKNHGSKRPRPMCWKHQDASDLYSARADRKETLQTGFIPLEANDSDESASGSESEQRVVDSATTQRDAPAAQGSHHLLDVDLLASDLSLKVSCSGVVSAGFPEAASVWAFGRGSRPVFAGCASWLLHVKRLSASQKPCILAGWLGLPPGSCSSIGLTTSQTEGAQQPLMVMATDSGKQLFTSNLSSELRWSSLLSERLSPGDWLEIFIDISRLRTWFRVNKNDPVDACRLPRARGTSQAFRLNSTPYYPFFGVRGDCEIQVFTGHQYAAPVRSRNVSSPANPAEAVVLCGPPGSGKTTWASKHASALSTCERPIHVLCAEWLQHRAAFTARGEHKPLHLINNDNPAKRSGSHIPRKRLRNSDAHVSVGENIKSTGNSSCGHTASEFSFDRSIRSNQQLNLPGAIRHGKDQVYTEPETARANTELQKCAVLLAQAFSFGEAGCANSLVIQSDETAMPHEQTNVETASSQNVHVELESKLPLDRHVDPCAQQRCTPQAHQRHQWVRRSKAFLCKRQLSLRLKSSMSGCIRLAQCRKLLQKVMPRLLQVAAERSVAVVADDCNLQADKRAPLRAALVRHRGRVRWLAVLPPTVSDLLRRRRWQGKRFRAPDVRIAAQLPTSRADGLDLEFIEGRNLEVFDVWRNGFSSRSCNVREHPKTVESMTSTFFESLGDNRSFLSTEGVRRL